MCLDLCVRLCLNVWPDYALQEKVTQAFFFVKKNDNKTKRFQGDLNIWLIWSQFSGFATVNTLAIYDIT